MKKRYLCPHCDAVLNPNVKVIFVIRKGGHHGLILLDPTPGEYALIADPNFPLEEGEMASFHCPVCGQDLVSKADEHFAEIQLSRGLGDRSLVEFSRIFGEHATFIVDGRRVDQFGEDAQDYEDINFFGH